MKQNRLILNSFVDISKQNNRYILIVFFLLIACSEKQHSQSTNKPTSNWHHLNLQEDAIPGIGLKKAYKKLIKKSDTEIIVAVIDTPIDINHPAFKSRLYINSNEIPLNQIDDDKNGYVDDIHGWNFLGYENDKSVYFTNYEIVRLIRQLENNIPTDSIKLKKLYQEYNNQKKKSEARLLKSNVDIEKFADAKKAFPRLVFSNGSVDTTTLKQIEPTTNEVADYKKFLMQFARVSLYAKRLEQFKTGGEGEIQKSLNPDYDDRKVVTGHGIVNDTENIFEHGTQIAGLIAEATNSKNYVNKSLLDIKLMFLCTSAVGDYHNNDLATAINYAVNNGARVINFSDSKPYSMSEEKVTQAIQYAEKNNVLIVTSAGNNNKNTDLEENYLYPKDYIENFEEVTTNFIVVGASTKNIQKPKASFSNYGNNTVDIFAPGSQITVPNGEIDIPYVRIDGTSLASALTSASAAIILTQHPDLKVDELKELLIQHGTAIQQDKFMPYSKSGKVLNLHKALLRLENQ